MNLVRKTEFSLKITNQLPGILNGFKGYNSHSDILLIQNTYFTKTDFLISIEKHETWTKNNCSQYVGYRDLCDFIF